MSIELLEEWDDSKHAGQGLPGGYLSSTFAIRLFTRKNSERKRKKIKRSQVGTGIAKKKKDNKIYNNNTGEREGERSDPPSAKGDCFITQLANPRRIDINTFLPRSKDSSFDRQRS